MHESLFFAFKKSSEDETAKEHNNVICPCFADAHLYVSGKLTVFRVRLRLRTFIDLAQTGKFVAVPLPSLYLLPVLLSKAARASGFTRGVPNDEPIELSSTVLAFLP